MIRYFFFVIFCVRSFRALLIAKSRGGLPYETDGDARRLTKGYKFWILVSRRVLRRNTELREENEKSNFLFSSFFPFLALSFRGQNLLKALPDWSPLGVTKSLSHAQMASFRG